MINIFLIPDQASVSWTMISLLLGFFVLIVGVFLIYACRQYSFTNISLPMVSSNNFVIILDAYGNF